LLGHAPSGPPEDRDPAARAMSRPVLVAVLGPTATGKSALGLALADRFAGEIVSCDSTAVYRGFDIGTDKVPPAVRRGVPHHLVDVVDPLEAYSAARYAADAASAIRSITGRRRLPILVGGTGLYYRALTRGLFPGPGRDPGLRPRLERLARRRGVTRLHRLLRRVDPASAVRIQPRDEKRLVRALEVYFTTGRPLTDHFAATRSPIAARVARRVDEQFARGLLDEVRALLARGVPPTAHPFTGLVYRQAIEHLQGVRDEAATRALIVRENRKYARRQLIWFRKEPNLTWVQGAGERRETFESVARLLEGRLGT
jgi:tRNA dimethylallyltransferase